MVGRVLELAKPGLSVRKRLGFLVVHETGSEAGRIGFDDIEAVLCSSPSVTWSNAALAELAMRQVPVMMLGSAFTPVAAVVPIDGHHGQALRFRAQADASRPLRKQAWARLVRQNIADQAATLTRIGVDSTR